MGPWDRTQAIRLGGKCPHPLIHLAGSHIQLTPYTGLGGGAESSTPQTLILLRMEPGPPRLDVNSASGPQQLNPFPEQRKLFCYDKHLSGLVGGNHTEKTLD